MFAVLHEGANGAPRTPFVFCHPLAEEKLWAHRVFVTFARELAARGHSVLRFDYMGNGDSDGDFSESSVSTALADVRCAIGFLENHCGRPSGLLGLRMGSTIASLVAEEATIEELILWAPVVDGARYMQELLRVNLTTQMAVHKEIREDREALATRLRAGQTVNVDGYEMALPMFEQVSAISLASGSKRHAGRTLIAHVDRQPQRVPPEVQRLAGLYPLGTLVSVEEEPFWKEIQRFYQRAPNLFYSTLEWLEQR